MEFLGKNDFISKEKLIQSAFYPILIREFFKQYFDHELYTVFLKSIDKNISVKKIYFELANFIWPKVSVNSVEFNREEVIKKLRFNKKSRDMLLQIKNMLIESDTLKFESLSANSFNESENSYNDIR